MGRHKNAKFYTCKAIAIHVHVITTEYSRICVVITVYGNHLLITAKLQVPKLNIIQLRSSHLSIAAADHHPIGDHCSQLPLYYVYKLYFFSTYVQIVIMVL